MRVLLVSHDFLPSHPAGTEIYTYQVGVALKERGHDVHVFTTDKDIARRNLTVGLRQYHELPVHELYNNLYYNDFRETWDYPAAARSFGVLLDDLKPDVVHFMHLLYLSVACVEEVAKRGIPVTYTLHDYWLQCARFGQRRYTDGTICHTIDFERCGRCLQDFKYRQTRTERATGKAIAALRSATGVDLGGVARAARRSWLRRKGHAEEGQARGEVLRAETLRDEVAERDKALRERILPAVDRFIAPSRFLRERFIEWGIPAERIDHMRTGIDRRPFAQVGAASAVAQEPSVGRDPAAGLRVAFIGTLAPHKGAHILVEAWGGIDPALRQRGSLRVFGPPAHNPGYVAHLEQLAGRHGVRLEGRLARSKVAEALASIDLLVVPSLWYENSPLIILEALATRTPLVVTDLGGMAELVEPGRTGFRFPLGDREALREVLVGCLEDPARLDTLFGEDIHVRDVAEDAADLEALYGEQLAARAEASVAAAERER